MQNYKLILPIEHQYLDNLVNYPVGIRMRKSSNYNKLMLVFEYFYQKGIRNFMIIGSDLWSYIPEMKSKHKIKVIAGGKIHSTKQGDKILEIGADQIVVAEHFYQKPNDIKKFVKHFGSKMICSINDQSGHLEGTSFLTRDFVKIAKKSGVSNFMYVNSDSKLNLKGVKTRRLSSAIKLLNKKFIYSGGVSNLQDLETLISLEITDIVVGTALYRGDINCNILDIDFKKGKGLIPVIIQDMKNEKVLMLGYMNKEAFSQTHQTGFVHFWSRERKKLWMKGETSGNKLKIEKIYLDCDKDALLIKVKLLGKSVCHTGSYSCFSKNVIVG